MTLPKEIAQLQDKRKALRALSMQALYELEFFPEEEKEQQLRLLMETPVLLEDADVLVLSEEEKSAFEEKILAILSMKDELDASIEKASPGWKLSRMSRVDLAILRLALYELRYDESIPVKVAINEAVDLAHLYGGDNSYQFVNGVLSVFAREADE